MLFLRLSFDNIPAYLSIKIISGVNWGPILVSKGYYKKAKTKNHKRGGLKTTDILSLTVMELDAPNQGVSSAMRPSKALQKNTPLPHPSCWWLLAILGIHRLVGAALQSLPLSSHGLFPCVSVSSPFFTWMPVIGFRVH